MDQLCKQQPLWLNRLSKKHREADTASADAMDGGDEAFNG
jgi:hypothetical protein